MTRRGLITPGRELRGAQQTEGMRGGSKQTARTTPPGREAAAEAERKMQKNTQEGVSRRCLRMLKGHSFSVHKKHIVLCFGYTIDL